MTLKKDVHGRRGDNFVWMLVALTLMLFVQSGNAQTTEIKPAETKADSGIYQTIYLANATQQNDANDVQTSLRNMLPRAKIYYAPASGALLLRGSAEDLQLAQKIVADLDKTRKTYRLTYTITESDGGKHVGAQRFILIAIPGGRSDAQAGQQGADRDWVYRSWEFGAKHAGAISRCGFEYRRLSGRICGWLAIALQGGAIDGCRGEIHRGECRTR